MSATPTTFGALLRQYRQAAGLTQEELAERARLSVRAISDLERGAHNRPWRDTVRFLADALQLAVSERARFEATARQVSPSPPGPVEQATPAVGTAIGSTIPTSLTRLIGRSQEKNTVVELLRRPGARMVTLTGLGGIGKTRLAEAVASYLAHEFREVVVYVPLDTISDHHLVAPAIARALAVRTVAGVSPWESLVEHIRESRLLLVLDNFEQVVDAAADLTTLLASCSNVRLLVTSRVPLHLYGEQEFLVEPLRVPQHQVDLSVDEALKSPAVQLFLERAQAVQADFALTSTNAPSVAALCRHLDGIPLAIELAAALVKAVPLNMLTNLLSRRLRLLGRRDRSPPSRQSTLRATFNWSYNLLSETERILFRRLSVFSGGFTLEAAEIVCSADGIAAEDVLPILVQVVDKSLIVVGESEGQVRYRLLETLREYGLERLVDSGEADAVGARHRDWCLVLAEPKGSETWGPGEMVWNGRMAADIDNLHAARAWCLEQDTEAGLRLARLIWQYWQVKGTDPEARRWLDVMLERATADRAFRAKAIFSAAMEARDHGQTVVAATRANESLVLSRETDDRILTSGALVLVGALIGDQGDYSRARFVLEEGLTLARNIGEPRAISWALSQFGVVLWESGDYEESRVILEEARDIERRAGSYSGLAWGLGALGALARSVGDLARARELLQESADRFRAMGDKTGLSWTLGDLAYLERSAGDLQAAGQLLRETLILCREIGRRPRIARTLCFAGILTIHRVACGPGLRLLAAANAIHPHVRAALSPVERADYERSVGAARVALGPEPFDQAWREGRSMSIEDALSRAREGLDESPEV